MVRFKLEKVIDERCKDAVTVGANFFSSVMVDNVHAFVTSVMFPACAQPQSPLVVCEHKQSLALDTSSQL